MEHRRGDHGRPVLRASGRAGGTRAKAGAVRVWPIEPARSDPGAPRQTHHLLLARDAAQSRPGDAKLRQFQGGVLRPDRRMLCALLSEYDEQKYSWALRLYWTGIRAGDDQYAR